MKKTAAAILFIILSGFGTGADAAPSFNGSTGMIDTPTADVLRKGQFSLGAYTLKDGRTGSVIVNVAPKLEIGWLGQRYEKSANLPNSNCFNAKFALATETVLTPGIAVGVEDIANADKRSWYMAASKGLIFGVRLHAGLGNGRYDGFFAAVEKTLWPVSITGHGGANLIAEWDGSRFNYGIRMSVAPGLRFDAGIRKKNVYLGVSFTN